MSKPKPKMLQVASPSLLSPLFERGRPQPAHHAVRGIVLPAPARDVLMRIYSLRSGPPNTVGLCFKHNRSCNVLGDPEHAPGRVNHFVCAGATDRSGLVHFVCAGATDRSGLVHAHKRN
ncbi:hypothetical protein L596_016963 [Steinernema carpocapsae]|uniref:Uncharacterized protein n=1 Tax=Steinernema carpocapsae TaxID=34508 RepID=A0A4U5N0A3_STECR|nr:hypothetical protein L596_016963 [Steinernema carpocapsae]